MAAALENGDDVDATTGARRQSPVVPGGSFIDEGRVAETLPVPERPSDEAIAGHMLTHVPCAAWRRDCVTGGATAAAHKPLRREPSATPVISADYCFLGLTAKPEAEREETDNDFHHGARDGRCSHRTQQRRRRDAEGSRALHREGGQRFIEGDRLSRDCLADRRRALRQKLGGRRTARVAQGEQGDPDPADDEDEPCGFPLV